MAPSRVPDGHPLVEIGSQLGFSPGSVSGVMRRLAQEHTRGEPCRLTLQHQDLFLDMLMNPAASPVQGSAEGGQGASGRGSQQASDRQAAADSVTQPGAGPADDDSGRILFLEDTDEDGGGAGGSGEDGGGGGGSDSGITLGSDSDDVGGGADGDDAYEHQDDFEDEGFEEEDFQITGFKLGDLPLATWREHGQLGPGTSKKLKTAAAPSSSSGFPAAQRPSSGSQGVGAGAGPSQRPAGAGVQGSIESFFKRQAPQQQQQAQQQARQQGGAGASTSGRAAPGGGSSRGGISGGHGGGSGQPWRDPPTAAQRAMCAADLANARVFGNGAFRPQQREAIDAALHGHDVFVLMPTGGGKSLCYQLPAVVCKGVTVVVCPLLSLMQDQVRALVTHPHCGGIPATYMSSQQSRAEVVAVLKELSKQAPTCKLLYVTPEQIVKSNALGSVLARLHSAGLLSRIVIDEAHCVSIWGHDFRPDYKALGSMRKSYPGVPIMAATATATEQVRADILKTLGMRGARVFTGSFFRSNLRFTVVDKQSGVDDNDRPQPFAQLIDYILEQGEGACGIVYCLSRDESETVARMVRAGGISAAHYHAGMNPKARQDVQNSWRAGATQVVVATIAFGMGIDKPNVRFVVHFTMSKAVEGYFQEAGRAGRDGIDSECIVFYSPRDKPRLMNLIRMGPRKSAAASAAQLETMIDYCEQEKRCRHDILLRYFSDTTSLPSPGSCGGVCDNCARKLRLPGAPSPRDQAGAAAAYVAGKGGRGKRKAGGRGAKGAVAALGGFVKASTLSGGGAGAGAGAGPSGSGGGAGARKGTALKPASLGGRGAKAGGAAASGAAAAGGGFRPPGPAAAGSAGEGTVLGGGGIGGVIGGGAGAAGKAAAARADAMRAAAERQQRTEAARRAGATKAPAAGVRDWSDGSPY
ncbi:hypothetical protein FOA52_000615 [Chlamydomonas sp. UWO 241]|nr:hypothetical protein FOA52_000615 [Chlamydomonas sp. UWO 241]